MLSMIKLVYASRSVARLDADALRELLSAARARNAEDGITGMLLYAHGSFLQLLEGDEAAVDTTFERISADDRHSDLRLLDRAPIEARGFGDWSMGFEEPDDDQLVESMPGYRPTGDLPLVNADTVHNGTIAEMLLRLYARRD